MRHLISFEDISQAEWEAIYKQFEDICANPADYRDCLSGRVMASLFYEPSTRTRFSFQGAMAHLGGSVFSLDNPDTSSVSKGESFMDTIIMTTGYADVAVIRHPSEGAALGASLYASCPVINAGDGGHLHPTQTMTDLAALRKLRGNPSGTCIGICGDLKYGRAAHSFIRVLDFIKPSEIYLISPPELRIPSYIRTRLSNNGIPFTETDSLTEALPELDVLYMTRVQRERFSSLKEYERFKGVYILDAEKMKPAKKDMQILHPLPRLDEIHIEVDYDPRAKYFEQAKIGMNIRMSLLLYLLNKPLGNYEYVKPARLPAADGLETRCKNEKCISFTEKYLPSKERDGLCEYCEQEL